MRAVLGSLVIVSGCVVGSVSPGTPDPAHEDTSSCLGGLPPPACGTGSCNCCVGCSQRDSLCFGDPWKFELGVGDCIAARASGSLEVTVDTARFAAVEVAAIVTGEYVEIAGRAGDRSLALLLPATLGTHSCTDLFLGAFAFYDGGIAEYWNHDGVRPRPSCTVTVTAVGAVGERVTGTFAATVVDRATATSRELVGGTFDVERVRY